MHTTKTMTNFNLFTAPIARFLPDNSLYLACLKDNYSGTLNAQDIEVTTRHNIANQSFLTGHWKSNDFEIMRKKELIIGNYDDKEINLTKEKAPFWSKTKIYTGNVGKNTARLEVTESFNKTVLVGKIGEKPFSVNIKTAYYQTLVDGLINNKKINFVIDNKGKVIAHETIEGMIRGKKSILPIILTFAHKNINRVARMKMI